MAFKINITATDVLHSFAVPSLGIKVDAVPGVLIKFIIHTTRGCILWECSELCGVNHGYMQLS